MALTDIPIVELTEIESAALEIRHLMRKTLGQIATVLTELQMIVEGRKADIAVALNPDAAALLSVYNSLKDAVETGMDITINNMPSS